MEPKRSLPLVMVITESVNHAVLNR